MTAHADSTGRDSARLGTVRLSERSHSEQPQRTSINGRSNTLSWVAGVIASVSTRVECRSNIPAPKVTVSRADTLSTRRLCEHRHPFVPLLSNGGAAFTGYYFCLVPVGRFLCGIPALANVRDRL